jgi:hypothetical protein
MEKRSERGKGVPVSLLSNPRQPLAAGEFFLGISRDDLKAIATRLSACRHPAQAAVWGSY